jgi:hypothetical protein
VRRDGWREQRDGRVLRFIGGADDRIDDEIGVDQFDDVPLVAGKRARARLAAMAHLRIAQRGHPLGRHAPPNAPLAGGRIRFQVLLQHASERRDRRLHGGCVRGRHVQGHPGL